MAEKDPKDPWSDEQLQSTPAGAPDRAPWTLTFAVIAILALLMLGGWLLWRPAGEPQAPAPTPSPASLRQE